jgi:uncharacterized protein involved in exopolysaccharide biosynthesis
MTNEPNDHDQYEDEDSAPGLPAQLRDPIRILRRQRNWILVSLILCWIGTAGATVLFPVKYEAQATILLTAKSIPDEFVPTTVIANILEEFDAIMGRVFSRDNLSKLIGETDLYEKERETLTLADLAIRLRSVLTVEPADRTSRGRDTPHSMAFEVKMVGEDPEILARVVNATVADLINANLEYRSQQARITTEFMKREFDSADEALRVQQRALAEFRAANRGALPEEQPGVISKLERLQDQRGNSILLISEFQARLERVDARPLAMSEDETLEALRARLQHTRAIYTDDHPNVTSLQRQLAVREELEAGGGLPSGFAASEERAEVAKSIELEQMRLDLIDATVIELEALIALTPSIAEGYEALVRKEIILQENYVEYLRKLKNAELALSLEHSQQGAQLTRLDSAIPPTSPVIPRWLIAAAGFVASIGFALALGIAREFLQPVIIDEQHLEDSMPIPCLGSINEFA